MHLIGCDVHGIDAVLGKQRTISCAYPSSVRRTCLSRPIRHGENRQYITLIASYDKYTPMPKKKKKPDRNLMLVISLLCTVTDLIPYHIRTLTSTQGSVHSRLPTRLLSHSSPNPVSSSAVVAAGVADEGQEPSPADSRF